jgi:hypothetical protein
VEPVGERDGVDHAVSLATRPRVEHPPG